MKNTIFTQVILTIMISFLLVGCTTEEQINDMKAQNRIQQQRIADLESDISGCSIGLEQLESLLRTAEERTGVDSASKNAEIAALESDIERKKKLIAKMQAQLLRSGAALPVELNVMLQEFAKNNDMVTFDVGSGVLKFESDLLFDKGSDKVASNAVNTVAKFCRILASDSAKEFDVVIAGHTDDIPIKKPATRAKHPTNWHLSVHRAISVLNIMTSNGVKPTRVSIRGFGQYKPAQPNKPGKGNSANRRVEIYIVPKGF